MTPYTEAEYRDVLYRLLPGFYRGRDTQGELRRLLLVFARPMARFQSDTLQLLNDFSIESCEDWVVPYLADLVGANLVFDDPSLARAEVRGAVRWNRIKGTLSGIEEVAAVIGGGGALAVEMSERLALFEQLTSFRPQGGATLDIAGGRATAALHTPFDRSRRTLDLRPADQAVGWHRAAQVNVRLWPIASFPWNGVSPAAVDAQRFRFHPLDNDVALYAGGDHDPVAGDLSIGRTTHVPVRRQDFRDHPSSYFGHPWGFTINEDGIAIAAAAPVAPTQSMEPLTDFEELAQAGGLIAADDSLFAGLSFQIDAMRLRRRTSAGPGPVAPIDSPVAPFGANFTLGTTQGTLMLPAGTYSKGLAYQPGQPDFHHPAMLLAISNTGAAAGFPESELILTNNRGLSLLAFLPALPALAPGAVQMFYIARDGATYFARANHGTGNPDRNPDGEAFGAFLSHHLAREAAGQVRPIAGVRPVAHRRVVSRNLCCWDQPIEPALAAGDVAIDPERGRFAFPAGEEPAGRVTVDFRFGRSGEIGAGPFFRGELPSPTLTVAQRTTADHATIQAAIDAAPDGGFGPVVIQIQDSGLYAESLSVAGRTFPGGLILQAAPLECPQVVAAAGAVLEIDAASSASAITIDGLVLAGGDVLVRGDVAQLRLVTVTADPATVVFDVAPAAAGAGLDIGRTILGVVMASANVDTVALTDTIVQHPLLSPDAAGGQVAVHAEHDLLLERVTVLGEVEGARLEVSNSVLFSPVRWTDSASCFRYSRVPAGLALPHRYRCTAAYPIVVDTRWTSSGYFHLHPNTRDAILAGGEHGGEMGAWMTRRIGLRERAARTKLASFAPIGREIHLVRALPRAAFPGDRRL